MEWVTHQAADKKTLLWLKKQFLAESEKGLKLSHVTRFVVDPEENPTTNLYRHWAEFIGGNPHFENAAYRRGIKGVQQTCFFGVEHRLEEYTALAKVAFTHMPGNFLRLTPLVKGAEWDRDTWTLALYCIGLRGEGRVPLNFQGIKGRSASTGARWPAELAADIGRDIDKDQDDLRRWQAETATRGEPVPRYLYVGLRQDVFTSSARAVDYFLEHADSLYGTYKEPVSCPSLTTSDSRIALPEPACPDSPVSANDARDAWMNELAQQGLAYNSIFQQLKRIAPTKHWHPLKSGQAVQAAIRRFRKRKRLQPLPARRRLPPKPT